ncbi:MAG: AI-2E family transporter [Thermodesulfobacteriota bacterium]
MERGPIAKIFFVTLLCSLALLLTLFWAYVTSIVLALLLASSFYPLYAWLKKVLVDRENLAALMVSFLILLVLIIPVGGFIGTLSREAMHFYERTKQSVSLKKIQEALEGDSFWAVQLRRAQQRLGMEYSAAQLETTAASVARNVGVYLSMQLSAIGSNILSFLVHFFLMMLIIFYILRDGVRLKAYLSELLPFPARQQNLIVSRFRDTAKAIIFGNGINAIAQGILGGLGFLFFGLGSPILWGTFIAFSALLPVVGATIVFVPATVVMLVQGQRGMAVAFLIYNLCYSAVMEYGVKPKLIGSEMRMNSLLVFIGILGGMKIFGIMGIIYGPLIMTIFLTLSEIYRVEYRDRLT